MAINTLPKAITKEVLFAEAQRRFQSWVEMFANHDISVQHMYEDMSCSCYCGNPADDFPDAVKAEQDGIIRYQYKDGNCSFMIDDIEVEVQDLRSMRESPRVGKALYADICIPTISYKEDGSFITHPIPDVWLYGSTSNDFDEGEPVHQEFIDAARDYIKIHHITKEMQEVQD